MEFENDIKKVLKYNKHVWIDSEYDFHVKTTKPWLKKSKKICKNCNVGWIHYYGIIPDFDTCMIICGVPLECSMTKNGGTFYYKSLTLEEYSQLENQNPKNFDFYCPFEHFPEKLCDCKICMEMRLKICKEENTIDLNEK